MKKLLIILLLICPRLLLAQFSEQLLNKIRYATDDYYIVRDTLPITGTNTLPCLDIMVNDTGPYRFLIDLGSNVLNFKQSVVKDANITIVVDRERGDIAKADKLTIGGSTFLNVYGAVYEDLDVDGVLGFNLLGKGNFMMDYPGMKFAFISDPDPNENISMDPAWIKYEELGRMPYINSKIGERNIYINFDTGAAGWLYFPSYLIDSLDLKTAVSKGNKTWNNQTGTTQSVKAQLANNVSFGDFVITEPTVVFLPDIEDAFVGSSLLKDFKLTFYPSSRLVKMERDIHNNIINTPEK